jgi:dipeptidyl aminopeptidase/acylaminoacyl peptidase
LGVDGHRIGLTGWSFGGFQTQYTMYTSPDTSLQVLQVQVQPNGKTTTAGTAVAP